MEIAKAAFNLQEALCDVSHHIPTGNYGLFKLIEDYGIRMLSYGNAGGGYFFAPYRSFLIEYKGMWYWNIGYVISVVSVLGCIVLGYCERYRKKCSIEL